MARSEWRTIDRRGLRELAREMKAAEENPVDLEHKSVGVNGFKVIDEETGIVETIVSVTGHVDRVKDNILPGSYTKTLQTRTPKGVWGHDWQMPISKTLEAAELLPGDPRLPVETKSGDPWPANAGGLLIRTQFNLETQRGQEAFADVKFFGDEQEWSIGYRVPPGKSRTEKKSGVRMIDEIDLFEYSPVLFGAMPLASTVSLKDALAEVVAEHGVEFVEAMVERMVHEKGEPEPEPEPTPEPEAKIDVPLEGTWEQTQRELRDLMQAAVRVPDTEGDESSGIEDTYVCIEATYADRVIASAYVDDVQKFFQAPWATVGGVVQLGPVEEIQISATIMTAAKEDGAQLETKAGRVLSAANFAKIQDALNMLQAVLDSATPATEGKSSEEGHPFYGNQYSEGGGGSGSGSAGGGDSGTNERGENEVAAMNAIEDLPDSNYEATADRLADPDSTPEVESCEQAAFTYLDDAGIQPEEMDGMFHPPGYDDGEVTVSADVQAVVAMTNVGSMVRDNEDYAGAASTINAGIEALHRLAAGESKSINIEALLMEQEMLRLR